MWNFYFHNSISFIFWNFFQNEILILLFLQIQLPFLYLLLLSQWRQKLFWIRITSIIWSRPSNASSLLILIILFSSCFHFFPLFYFHLYFLLISPFIYLLFYIFLFFFIFTKIIYSNYIIFFFFNKFLNLFNPFLIYLISFLYLL